ncbi:DUF1304 family protein [Streptococcus merionis]|uniref:DUF1304 family protein n=1 Tax=Streptococcus merionis TaxID=400065 RepID=UPI0026F124B4|nr:DUF1304 family protein [Streptococcus merionis]
MSFFRTKGNGEVTAVILKILATLVAVEFFYIMYLETFATTSQATARVFKMSQEELANPIAVFVFPSMIWLRLLMLYILLVATYGGVTSQPSIIFKQGGLAFLVLIVSFL